MPHVSQRLYGILLLLTACQRDLEGRACACVAGYSCCEADQRCYRVSELEQHCPKERAQPGQATGPMSCAPDDQACLGRDAAAPSADAATDPAIVPAADGGSGGQSSQRVRDAGGRGRAVADDDAGTAGQACDQGYVQRQRPCASCSDSGATEENVCVRGDWPEQEERRVAGGNASCSIAQDDDAGVVTLPSRLMVTGVAYGGIAPDARTALINKATAEIDNGSCQGKENHPVQAESLELTMIWTVTFTAPSSCRDIPPETYLCTAEGNAIKLRAKKQCIDKSGCDLELDPELYIPSAPDLRVVELTFQIAYVGKSYGRPSADGSTMVAVWKPQ